MDPQIVEKVRGRRPLILALTGVTLGLLASVMAYHYLEREETQLRDQLKSEHAINLVRVVVARSDLATGVSVGDDNMAIREVPRDFVYPETILPDGFDKVRGQALVKPLGKGQPLLAAYLEEGGAAGLSDKVGEGRRAVTINVDEVSSLNGMIQPGDSIDLLLSARDAEGNAVLPLLQAVKVLATGSRMRAVDGSAPGQDKFGMLYATLTLDVSPEDAERVIVARGAGTLTAVLRARGDDRQGDEASGPLHSSQLFSTPTYAEVEAPAVAPETISYIMPGSVPGVASIIQLPIGASFAPPATHARPVHAPVQTDSSSEMTDAVIEPASVEQEKQ